MSISPSQIVDWSIYKITSPTGRNYIGLTSNLNNRIGKYKKMNCKNQPIVYRSFLKYGVEAHKIEVIDRFSSNIEYAYGKEMFWIRSYMASPKWGKFGLNSTDGGSGSLGMIHPESAKKKIGDTHRGKKWSEERKKKFSELKKGLKSYVRTKETIEKLKNSSKGRKLSQETKDKISKTRLDRKIPSSTKGIKLSEERKKQIGLSKVGNTYTKGRKVPESEKERLYKKVLVFDLNGNFLKECSSVNSTIFEFGVSKGTIRNSANGITKHHTKFIFKFKDNGSYTKFCG